jgi:hypothetical protein
MQNYIVRIYRAHHGDAGSVAGILEDIESGDKIPFHNLNELQTMLADSIVKGQFEFSNFASQELETHEDVAVIG